MERASLRLGLYHRLDQLEVAQGHKYLEETSVNRDLLSYLKSPHRKELMRARDWKKIFGKSIVEPKQAERRERLAPSDSSPTAASDTGAIAFQEFEPTPRTVNSQGIATFSGFLFFKSTEKAEISTYIRSRVF